MSVSKQTISYLLPGIVHARAYIDSEIAENCLPEKLVIGRLECVEGRCTVNVTAPGGNGREKHDPGDDTTQGEVLSPTFFHIYLTEPSFPTSQTGNYKQLTRRA